MTAFLLDSAWWLGHVAAAVLCLVGVFVSLLSFTGAWLVLAASGLLFWIRDGAGVSLGLVAAITVACVLLEVFDFLAGSIGISRRGGSAAAGWAALLGGLAGMLLGALIPVPVLGSLLGMCAGSFLLAYAVEHQRLKHRTHAAHIAWGAVWARLGVMVVKTAGAMTLSALLWYGVLFQAVSL